MLFYDVFLMRLLSLSLEQFRSYSQHSIDFSGGSVSIFVGPNGAGKTNVIEAISVLSLTKSCQGLEEQDLIQWEKEYYRVQCHCQNDQGDEKTLEVTSQIAPRKQKGCFVNDVRTPLGDMVGTIPTVLFLPQDLQLFSGPPANRRAFIDQLLCQVSPQYLKVMADYKKVLKQRNSLLKRIAEGSSSQDDLAIWDAEVAQKGASITLRRLEMIEVLECTLTEELRALGEHWNDVHLVYDRKGAARTIETAEQELKDLLEHYRSRDIILQSTTVGPHREDWHIEVDGRSLPTFASRGQQRTAVLALLFLKVSYVELRRQEKPVILLDDVFSELDDAHQSALLSSFDDHQVIITTTHIPESLHGASVFTVADGKIIPEKELTTA